MPVNPSEKAFFELLASQAKDQVVKPLQEQSLEEFRSAGIIFNDYTGGVASVPYHELYAPARDGYQIPIRIYNPNYDASKPVFIMYPGCGYVLDLFEANAIMASRIATFADIKVIIVNFRLCPEVKMPVPINDAFDATKYIAQHSKEFNIDPTNIFIGGLSSGAHAAANVSSMSRFDDVLTVKYQILLNGCYDLTQSNHQYDTFEAEDKICQRGSSVDYLFAQYQLKPAQYNQAPFSPLFEKDVSQMPDTTFLIAEYDGIRNDSEAYYQHLSAQNNNIERIILTGQTHNTILMRGAMTDGEDPALTIANIIKQNSGRN